MPSLEHRYSIDLKELELDPNPILARMRAEEPVCFVPSLDMWLVTKWDDLMFPGSASRGLQRQHRPVFLGEGTGPEHAH
ncbi:MAG: hypothetical protein Ct9H300mP12_08490 [Acidimicrobiales bacterium]|nr:MAG: hypothetical protein Ct9H300mP12_08490 [Acidimicrobiales bacterium]